MFLLVLPHPQTGNTYHKDEKGKFMPIVVQGDPNKPRAKWEPPTSSKNNAIKKKQTKTMKKGGRIL